MFWGAETRPVCLAMCSPDTAAGKVTPLGVTPSLWLTGRTEEQGMEEKGPGVWLDGTGIRSGPWAEGSRLVPAAQAPAVSAPPGGPAGGRPSTNNCRINERVNG